LINKRLINKLYNDGYIIKKKLISDIEIDKILFKSKNIFRKQFIDQKHSSKSKKFYKSFRNLHDYNYKLFLSCAKQVQKIPDLYKLQCSRKIEKILLSLDILEPVLSYTPLILFNSKYLKKYNTSPHQDWRSMQGSLDSIVIWIAMQDINDGYGNIELIKGSHKRGLLPSKKDNWFRSIKKDFNQNDFESHALKKGDALIFSTFLIHKTGNFKTSDIRWSLQFRFNNLSEKSFIKRGFPDPYFHQPNHDILNKNFPTKKQLLDFFKNSDG